ncbi:hypothetical protein [Mycolicibacterium stellerae]|uniref:hypothetical protein n=1 Tax=Mycolicibacterium stellerae TaxID=2358193 RepID=UPI0013DE4FBB|nr:hypothetical protein [Mycolicibacterium stellerae]
MKKRTKKFAAVTAVTATTAALTVGMAPPSPDKALTWRDVMLAADIDYIQLIEDMSKSLDNIIIAQGNIGEGFESFWDPISSASGGLLPSFDSEYDYDDLTTLSGILDALSEALADGTNVEAVPGISDEAAATVLAGILAGLGVDTGAADSLATVLEYLGALDGTLGGLSELVDALNSLGLTDDIDLSELLGLTANTSSLTTTWSWLGLDETTSIGNTYVNLDELSVSELVGSLTALLGADTDLGGLLGELGLGSGLGSLDDILGALDVVSTPDVTVWIPAASGSYDLPLDGSVGFLAAMPTIAIGPLSSLTGDDLSNLLTELGIDDSLVDLNSDTVIAIPIYAAGVELPLDLASYGVVGASVLFPTATGVTSLAGTTVQTLDIPLLSTTVTNTNTLQAWYVGTNGVNYNSGQSVLLLNVGGTVIPIEYSMGSFNFGTTGVGVTLPSLFGVGLVPSIQIGEPVGQESSDGLIGADVLNAVLNTPTQTTDVASLIGLGGVFSTGEAAGTSVWNATAKPVGQQFQSVLDDNVGSWANGLASGFEQLTGSVADATGGDQSATTMSSTASTAKVDATEAETEPAITTKATDLTNVSAQLSDTLTNATSQIQSTANNAKAKTEAAVKSAQSQLNSIASSGQKAINDTVSSVKNAVSDTANKVTDAAKKATSSTGS